MNQSKGLLQCMTSIVVTAMLVFLAAGCRSDGRTLPSATGSIYEVVVVADEEKVLSLAGIMGGEESGISEQTSKIFIECAHFDAGNIRVVSQKTGLFP